MFNLLYMYLYAYVHTSSYLKQNLLYSGSHKTNYVSGFYKLGYSYEFNLSGVDLLDRSKVKKKHILFLKKNLFFFRFLNRPLHLFIKLMRRYKNSYKTYQKNINSFQCTRLSSIKGSFNRIRSKRPMRGLYYRINRSRPLVASLMPELYYNKDITSFVSKSHNRNIFKSANRYKYFKSLVVVDKDPLDFSRFTIPTLDNFSWYGTRRNIKPSFFFEYKKIKSRKRINRLRPKKKRRRLKYITMHRFMFKTAVSNNLFSTTKYKKISIAYYMWWSVLNLLSRKCELHKLNSGADFYNNSISYLVNSNLTGISISDEHNRTKFNFIKGGSLAASTVSIYNLKTYNWLVTI